MSLVEADFNGIARLVADMPDRPDRYESFLLAQLPARSGRILEIGCGSGRLARAIAERGGLVTGIDASPEMIRLARSRTRDGARVEFVCGDFSALSMEPETYEAVVSVATLHHLPTVPTLARMKSLLKPGGRLVIHDLRAPSGIADWLGSAWASLFNGDAVWWVGHRLRQGRALRSAWREHGSGERYFGMEEVRGLCETSLRGAKAYWHPLWRYTVVWTKGGAEACHG